MTRCLLVDDEPLALEVLAHYLSQEPGMEVVSTCANALEAFAVISREKIDLVFLDIRMPGLSGTDFVRSLKEPPAIIFTTAYAEYAQLSYELEAIDYLLKPVTHERFKKSIARFLKLHPEPGIKPYTYFKVNGRLQKVMHSDLICAQSVKDYIVLRTATGEHITHMTMKYLEELLPGQTFLRVHRSYLVAASHITSIGKSSLQLGTLTVPVGENYRQKLKGGAG